MLTTCLKLWHYSTFWLECFSFYLFLLLAVPHQLGHNSNDIFFRLKIFDHLISRTTVAASSSLSLSPSWVPIIFQNNIYICLLIYILPIHIIYSVPHKWTTDSLREAILSFLFWIVIFLLSFSLINFFHLFYILETVFPPSYPCSLPQSPLWC